MRTVFVLLAAVAVVVLGEPCRENRDCERHHVTSCQNGTHVACVHHLCTCYDRNTHGYTCTTKANCELSSVNLPCGNDMRHCIDGNCHCERNRLPGGGDSQN